MNRFNEDMHSLRRVEVTVGYVVFGPVAVRVAGVLCGKIFLAEARTVADF